MIDVMFDGFDRRGFFHHPAKVWHGPEPLFWRPGKAPVGLNIDKGRRLRERPSFTTNFLREFKAKGKTTAAAPFHWI